jgi:hypothetical protein
MEKNCSGAKEIKFFSGGGKEKEPDEEPGETKQRPLQ